MYLNPSLFVDFFRVVTIERFINKLYYIINMTILIGFQGDGYVIAGSDLLIRTALFGVSQHQFLVDKIRKSKNGNHYLAWTGHIYTIEEEELSKKPLDELVCSSISLKPALSRDLNAHSNEWKLDIMIIDPNENQLYYAHNLNNRKILPGEIVVSDNVRIDENTSLMDLAKDMFKCVSGKEAYAEVIKRLILESGKVAHDRIFGALVYISENRNFKEYYRSHHTKTIKLEERIPSLRELKTMVEHFYRHN